MPYLISALVAVAGVVVLCMLLMRLIGPVRQLAGTARISRAEFAERRGPLTVRITALRAELTRRRRRRGNAKASSESATA